MRQMVNQQGDVILFRIKEDDVPENAEFKPAGRVVLAEGEVTGHSHDAVGSGLAVAEVNGKKYLRAEKKSVLTHQEHGTQVVEPGVYEVENPLQYDHFEEEAREVRD